jgi:uncharacterized coiled-coil DUF342 family protein
MNAQRRKQIEAIKTKLEEAKSDIESLQGEEQDYYDNMPEAIQAGEKGDRASEAADALQSAAEAVEEVTGLLDEATQ